jgi:CRP-like cAMP-binding protein
MIRGNNGANAPIQNRLLNALPTIEYERMLPNLEEVSLTDNTVLYDVGDKLTCVYFPNRGIISLLGAVDGNSTLEVGVIGHEGMSGLPLFMGVKTSRVRSIVQVLGTAMRMTKADFDDECGKNGFLPALLLRFSYSMMLQVWQSAMCFRCHTVEERIVRRLLMTSDRMGTNEFKITHHVLSNMIGVRREAISLAAGNLRKKDLITYTRGDIRIINRPALEASACKCYSIIRDEERSAGQTRYVPRS